MNVLPFPIAKVGVPPIKCQGIKTKLVPFIFTNIQWTLSEQARWVEPFLGSGVVAFNLAPERALLTDTNRHIVCFYQAVQCGEMSQQAVREFLVCEGKKLEAKGADYFYEVRRRFNECSSPFDFLFLNRACFNGVMRFNRKGAFNVPFGHKPQRFSQAYVTKIVNQVGWVAKQMRGRDWEFRVASWDQTLREVSPKDFVYLDPPYIGRHADYYNAWNDQEAMRLSTTAKQLQCGYALSMWLENRHRRNQHIAQSWSEEDMRVCQHFYHVGATENLRNAMSEALMIKPGFSALEAETPKSQEKSDSHFQLHLALERRALYGT